MTHAEPNANIPENPDPVAPQKFLDVDTTADGQLFLYGTLDEQREEWMTAAEWVDAREIR